MKTSKDYTIADYRGYGEITVPVGTALTHQTALGFDAKYHFVADLTFIRKNYPQFHEMQLLHDAMHYGIDVPVEYVDYELATTKDVIIENATEPQVQYTLSLNGIALYTGTKKECVAKVNKMPTLDYNNYTVEPSVSLDEVIDLRKTKPVMGSYYADQLSKLGNAHEGYPVLVKLTHGLPNKDTNTNWLSLNDDSATDLVKWLHENYNIS